MSGVSIQNFTRHTSSVAGLPFNKIAKEVLPDWEISLVFAGPTRARALNQKLRNKDYVPNVLSYVVGARSAEIIICPSEAAKQAPDFELSARAFLILLFIHGALHIKGWGHSGRMEARERKLLAKFVQGVARPLSNPNGTTHRNRHRHRHVPGQNGRRRGTLR